MQSNNNPLSYAILLLQMGKKATQLQQDIVEKKKAALDLSKVQQAQSKAKNTLQWQNQPAQSKVQQSDQPIKHSPHSGFGKRR